MSDNLNRIDHLRMIKHAVSLQASDDGLWATTADHKLTIAEAYLQESLRDLHRVIEDIDIEALDRIEARLNP